MRPPFRPNRAAGPLAVAWCAVLAASLAAAPAPEDRDISALTKKIFPSVVRIEVQNHVLRVATGVVLDGDGNIVTTALIAPKEEKITVVASDGRRIPAEFRGSDPETRLAVVRAKDKGLVPIAMGKASDAAVGAWICVVGIAPEGGPAVTQGIVSSASEDMLRLNAWVTPGSSGGPVLDAQGRLVGLLRGVYMDERPVVFSFRDREQVGQGYVYNSGAQAPASGMAVAVPVDVVTSVSSQIEETGRVSRGWLGAQIGEDDQGRVQIVDVSEDSPAEMAKLQRGDVILKLDGRDVTGATLARELRRRKPGTTVTLAIERDGKPMDVKVKLGEYTPDEARRELELRFPDLFFAPGAPEAPNVRAVPVPPAGRAPRPIPPVIPTPRGVFETRKFIGIVPQDLTPDLAKHFGAKDGQGLLVSSVTAGGPAEKAGIKVGDVLTKVDGKAIAGRDDLIDAIQAKPKGDKIKIDLIRDGKPMTVEVAVDEEESGIAFFETKTWDDVTKAWKDSTSKFQQELKNLQRDGSRQWLRIMKRPGNVRSV